MPGRHSDSISLDEIRLRDAVPPLVRDHDLHGGMRRQIELFRCCAELD